MVLMKINSVPLKGDEWDTSNCIISMLIKITAIYRAPYWEPEPSLSKSSLLLPLSIYPTAPKVLFSIYGGRFWDPEKLG